MQSDLMTMTAADPSLSRNPRRARWQDEDKATLLGLYHGYDQSRIALGKLVARYGTEAASPRALQRELFGRARREGFTQELHEPRCAVLAHDGEEIHRGAHSATLTAFATLSDKAEELLRLLRERWPDLCQDAGGPLPAPTPGWEPEWDLE